MSAVLVPVHGTQGNEMLFSLLDETIIRSPVKGLVETTFPMKIKPELYFEVDEKNAFIS